MLQLLIMRHGTAEQQGSSDAMRSLTPLGWQQSVAMAHWLQQQPMAVQHALVSPYQRAQQTFTALQSVLPALKQLPHSLNLTPQGSATAIIEQLSLDDTLQLPVLLIISHMPLVSHLVSAICPDAPMVSFMPATMVAIACSTGCSAGVQQWIKSPAR